MKKGEADSIFEEATEILFLVRIILAARNTFLCI